MSKYIKTSLTLSSTDGVIAVKSESNCGESRDWSILKYIKMSLKFSSTIEVIVVKSESDCGEEQKLMVWKYIQIVICTLLHKRR